MPRSASSPQYLETRRLSKAQLFAMRASHEEGLGWDTRRPSDHNYLFVPGRLLVDTEDAGPDQVIDVFNRRKSDLRIPSTPERDDGRTPKIDGLDSYRFVSRERLPDESEAAYERARRRDLVNAVRIYDEELGPGVVTPEHYVHVAGSGNGRACPATEPAETVLAQAWPAEQTDKTVGDKIRVVVIDTGWPQPADETAAAADVNAGNYGQLPALPPYAGHGLFAEEVVRSHAPGADISHLEFPITSGGTVNEVDLAHLLQQALALNPQVINMSAGCHTRHDRPLKAFERVWRNQSTAPKDRPVVIAAAGNDASPSPFYPAASPWAIGVGSLDQDNEVSSFSNYRQSADVFIIGRNHVNRFPLGRYTCHWSPNVGNHRMFTTGYARWSGTSFAAPLLAGLVAAHLSGYAGTPREGARDLIRDKRVWRNHPIYGDYRKIKLSNI